MEGRPGFVIAPWCGSAECEAQIKTDTQATIRNMPIDGATPSGRLHPLRQRRRPPKRGSRRVTSQKIARERDQRRRHGSAKQTAIAFPLSKTAGHRFSIRFMTA